METKSLCAGCLQSSKEGFLRESSSSLPFCLSVGLSYVLTVFGHVDAASPYDDSLYSVSNSGSSAMLLSETLLIAMKRATI